MKFLQLQEHFGKERSIEDIIINTSWLHCEICYTSHEPKGEPIFEELYPVLVDIDSRVFGLCKKHFLEAWDTIHGVIKKEEERIKDLLPTLKEKNDKMDQLMESVIEYYSTVEEHDTNKDVLIKIFHDISLELTGLDIMKGLRQFKKVTLEGVQK